MVHTAYLCYLYHYSFLITMSFLHFLLTLLGKRYTIKTNLLIFTRRLVMAVTIRDVAMEAGVSTSTVSKVLNHWSSISEETCARVWEAIEKLNYTPNARAVSFARGTTKNIIFLSSLQKEEAYHNPHMFDILCGVHRKLAENGYTLMLEEISKRLPAKEIEILPADHLRSLISSRIADGILIHGSCSIPGMEKILQETKFPHIYIGHPGPGSRMCWIDTNNGLAGQVAAQHMLECRYERVAFIAESRTDHISMQRLNGFLGGMYEYGYRIPDHYIRHTDSSREDAYRQTKELLDLPEPPRAIVCENNALALGVSKALQEYNVQVPKEVAFLTFDSYPYSALIEPKPTIIDIDVYDLGVQAAVMLLRKLENPLLLVQSYTTLPVLRQGHSTCKM